MRAVEGWQVRQPAASAPKADAIVVLSGMLRVVPGTHDTAEWRDAVDRFDAGVELARAGKAPLLVFTSEWYPWMWAASTRAGSWPTAQWNSASRAIAS